MTHLHSLQAAKDPTTDIGRLLSLAESHPREVIDNPAFLLELVVDPHLLRRLAPRALAALARCETAQGQILERAVVAVSERPPDRSLFDALMSNRNLDPGRARRAAAAFAPEHDVNGAGPHHRHVFEGDDPGSLLVHLQRALDLEPGLLETGKTLAGLGLENAIVPRGLLRLGSGKAAVAAGWAAEAAFTGPAVLAYLGQAPEHRELRPAVARHPNTPGSTLLRLAADGDVDLAELARHPRLPESGRRELLERGEPLVRYALAGNPSLGPDEQLELIATGYQPAIERLVTHERLSEEAQLCLAILQERHLCLGLLHRPDLSDEALAELLRSQHASVALGAREYQRQEPEGEAEAPMLERFRERFRTRAPTFYEALVLATASNTAPEILEGFADSSWALVRLAVAAHPATPLPTREWLAGDPDVRVANAAREEPSLPT